nr:hypothetical protein [Tanacetum cinerariifolium]
MEWLPMCAKLEMAVSARNWLDMLVLCCQKFVSEHREFAIRMNRLVGEMNEACQDRIPSVRELESMVGVTVTMNTIVFLKEMMDKAPVSEKFVVSTISDLNTIGTKINALCARVTTIIEERENLVGELDILVGRSVPVACMIFDVRNVDALFVRIIVDTCVPGMHLSLLAESLVVAVELVADEMLALLEFSFFKRCEQGWPVIFSPTFVKNVNYEFAVLSVTVAMKLYLFVLISYCFIIPDRNS